MILDIFLVTVALIILLLSSITDLKKREIPDFLSYSLLSIAIFTKILQSSIEKSLSPVIYAVIGFIIFYIIALLMYYTKQWGGGDSKLLIPLGIIFSQYPKTLLNYFSPDLKVPILITLFINILLIGAIYGIFYSIVLAIKNKERFLKEIKKINTKNIKYYIILSVFILLVSIFINVLSIKLLLLIFSLFIILIPYLLIFIKAIEKSCMIKRISIEKLTEGDWITENIYNEDNKIIYSSKSPGVTLKQINEIKRLNKKDVTIKEGIPFIPSFLIAAIITLIYGNIIFFI